MAIGETYTDFVGKFVPKRTTDDCYTPAEVYDIVLDYVRMNCDIEGCEVVRPFYPGMSYETYPYPDSCIVVDNPPFSIITPIIRFYQERGIRFFLFAPHLTLFSANLDVTRIVVGADIVYENGAEVKTSFMSNMFGTAGVIGDPYIRDRVAEFNKSKTANLPKYVYPVEVLTVSKVQKFVDRGVGIRVEKKDLQRVNTLDAQRPRKKSIFGCGYFLSRTGVAKIQAAEQAAEQYEREAGLAPVEWELSEREKQIINNIG